MGNRRRPSQREDVHVLRQKRPRELSHHRKAVARAGDHLSRVAAAAALRQDRGEGLLVYAEIAGNRIGARGQSEVRSDNALFSNFPVWPVPISPGGQVDSRRR